MAVPYNVTLSNGHTREAIDRGCSLFSDSECIVDGDHYEATSVKVMCAYCVLIQSVCNTVSQCVCVCVCVCRQWLPHWDPHDTEPHIFLSWHTSFDSEAPGHHKRGRERERVRVCVRACVRACVRVCVCVLLVCVACEGQLHSMAPAAQGLYPESGCGHHTH